MKKIIGIAILMACAFLFACSGNSGGGEDSITVAEKAESGKPAGALFNLKSGIITFESGDLLGKQEIVTSFDDYGLKQRTEIQVNVFGQKLNNITITDAASKVSYDPDKMIGSRSEIDPRSPEGINFLSLTDEVKKEFSIRDEGEAVVLGRKCTIYSLKNEKAGLSGKYYIWNGITLKTDVVIRGKEVKMEAVKIEENAVLPSTVFKVPEGLVFKDLCAL